MISIDLKKMNIIKWEKLLQWKRTLWCNYLNVMDSCIFLQNLNSGSVYFDFPLLKKILNVSRYYQI